MYLRNGGNDEYKYFKLYLVPSKRKGPKIAECWDLRQYSDNTTARVVALHAANLGSDPGLRFIIPSVSRAGH